LRLLDIGCGSAVFLKLAHEQGYDVFGLDSSREAAEWASKEVPERVFCGTVEDLINAGQSFDLLVLLHVLEHVLDPFQYLRKLRELLRPNGGLIIQVPNVQSLQSRIFGSRWYGLDCPRHICNFSLYSLLFLLGRCGFRIEKVRHFSFRDNAAAIVSSLLPRLDPILQRIRSSKREDRMVRTWLGVSELVYFLLVMSAQPFAWAEAKLGRGGTVTVYATL
jgi:SAM-dependent methyltransferase